jgi:hypothetical protein
VSAKGDATRFCIMVANADAIVANNALRRFNVIFDYARQRLLLRPNSHVAEPFT